MAALFEQTGPFEAANPILSLNYTPSYAKLSRVFRRCFPAKGLSKEGFAHEQSHRQEREETGIALHFAPFICSSIIPPQARGGG